ncbi:MAG: sigma-54 dependent transcriptional regulator [Ignavibacteria bacterium]|jgi:DNA-binding NtrC family response regulator
MNNKNIKILIVDDEPNSTQILRKILTKKGYAVSEENNSLKAKQLINENFFDIIISDLQMPEVDGMDLLKLKPVDSIFIMITGYGSVVSAVESMKNGAFDYINKPFNLDEFTLKVEKAVEKINMTKKIHVLKTIIEDNYPFKNIIGNSKKMLEVFDFIGKISRVNVNVLIEGQSGTGKELVARAIHQSSDRKSHPFIAINCSAIPENLLESELFGHAKGAFTGATETQKGVFEQADGGTLFLDEIAEMPYNLQAKLLRVIENWEIKSIGSDKIKKVDIRLISATNQNLKEFIKQKNFREDLYYRLATFSILLPPLSERITDIPLIINHYLKILSAKFAKDFSITPAALDALIKHKWAGNVRELENILEQAAIITTNETIDTKHFNFLELNETFDDCLKNSNDLSLNELEKRYIFRVLEDNDWNKAKVSQILKIDRKTLYKKIKDNEITEKKK